MWQGVVYNKPCGLPIHMLRIGQRSTVDKDTPIRNDEFYSGRFAVKYINSTLSLPGSYAINVQGPSYSVEGTGKALP
ncbi:unnamed protein product, partial [marine sediment metagenome]